MLYVRDKNFPLHSLFIPCIVLCLSPTATHLFRLKIPPNCILPMKGKHPGSLIILFTFLWTSFNFHYFLFEKWQPELDTILQMWLFTINLHNGHFKLHGLFRPFQFTLSEIQSTGLDASGLGTTATRNFIDALYFYLFYTLSLHHLMKSSITVAIKCSEGHLISRNDIISLARYF